MARETKLSYDGLFVDELIQESSVDNLDINNQVQFPDMTTEIFLVTKWSQEDFTRVFSALVAGAYVTSGDDAMEVIDIFSQLIGGDVNICDALIDCLQNDPATQQAFVEAVQAANSSTSDSGYSPPPMSPAQTAQNLLPGSYICDDDHLCGMSRWIVDNLHKGTLQLLQQLEAATNTWELLAQFVDNVEVVSWFGSGLELAAWLQDQLLEYYELAYSATVEDSLTCDIFCTIKPDCEVSIDLLLSAYEAAVLESFTIPTLASANELWDWVEQLDYETATAKAIVGSFHWVVLQALRFGSSALRFVEGIRTLEQMIATGEDETDTYCGTNCACSPTTWCYENDFTTSLGDWAIRVVAGTPIGTLTGNGVESVNFSSASQTQVYLQADSVYAWKNLEIEYVRSGADGSALDDERLFIANDTNTGSGQILLDDVSSINVNGTITRCFETGNTTTRNQIVIMLRANETSQTLTIKRIKVWGSGEPPGGITDNACTPACT